MQIVVPKLHIQNERARFGMSRSGLFTHYFCNRKIEAVINILRYENRIVHRISSIAED